MSEYGLSPESVYQIKQFFKDADLDGSGNIDPTELKDFVQRATGKDLSNVELEGMMKVLDKDGNGVVDIDEFIQGMSGFLLGKPIKKVVSESPTTIQSPSESPIASPTSSLLEQVESLQLQVSKLKKEKKELNFN